jgi:hypothetical protein
VHQLSDLRLYQQFHASLFAHCKNAYLRDINRQKKKEIEIQECVTFVFYFLFEEVSVYSIDDKLIN